jgi:hypothetical protein
MSCRSCRFGWWRSRSRPRRAGIGDWGGALRTWDPASVTPGARHCADRVRNAPVHGPPVRTHAEHSRFACVREIRTGALPIPLPRASRTARSESGCRCRPAARGTTAGILKAERPWVRRCTGLERSRSCPGCAQPIRRTAAGRPSRWNIASPISRTATRISMATPQRTWGRLPPPRPSAESSYLNTGIADGSMIRTVGFVLAIAMRRGGAPAVKSSFFRSTAWSVMSS